MSTLINDSDLGFVAQLTTFKEKIGDYATVLGLTTPELEAINNDAEYFTFMVMGASSAKDYSKAWTARKDRARKGGAASMGPFPVAVNLDPLPTEVLPGVEKRFSALVASIKTNANYNNDMGIDLGIVASGSEPTIDAPVLTIKKEAGKPVIGFKKGASDGTHIYSRRGSEVDFQFLATDTQSPYVDNRPNLVPGTPEKREYYAYYFKKDETVGDQSAVVSITI